MRHHLVRAALLAAASVVPAARPHAQQQPQPGTQPPQRASDRLQLSQYLDFEDVREPQLSPDGRQVIYTRRYIDKLNDRWENALWIVNADGSRNHFLVNGSSPQWSPDGTRVAYLAKGEPNGAPQLWVRYLDADAAATQITRVTDALSDHEWSPDGRWIAFRMLVPSHDAWPIDMPTPPKGAKWTEPPRVITRLVYRADRQGFLEDGYRHLFVVPADGGTPRQITSGDWDHGAPRWTPDGRTLVFAALRAENAEYAYQESEIYAEDVATGAIRQLTHRKGPDLNPVVSPDGRYIAYTGNDSTDDTWVDQRLYVMNIDGSNPRILTGRLDRTPVHPMWARDGSAIYFNVDDAGTRNLYVAPLTGPVRQVTRGTHLLFVTDVDRAGHAVGTQTTFTRPNDVVIFDVRAPRPQRITGVNDALLTGKTLAQAEELRYRSFDGLEIQGWIVKPPDFDPAKRYPLILDIHGGPHAMYNVGFSYARQDHAAHGYVVLYTNPRGSTGYGSAFGNAIKFDYPGKDFTDLMVGVDTVIGRGYIDPRSLYVYGCSGGGLLTAWTVGHTNRFAAAAALCPVTDWFSFAGTTDINMWGYHRFARFPWQDPTTYLTHSPIMYADSVRTPTLLMTGVLDLRTPISQTEEFYQALKTRRVPTAMVRFNEEYHGTTSKPSNFLRTQLYLRSWFDRWGPKQTTAATRGR